MSEGTIRFGQYSGGYADSRRPSGVIWGDCPPESAFMDDPMLGTYIWDDFTTGCPDVLGGTAVYGTGKYGYSIYADTGVIFAGEEGTNAYVGGILEISGNDADNDEGNMSMAAPNFVVSDNPAVARKLWMECRIKKASIADEGLAFFVGLAYDHTTGLDIAVADAMSNDEADLGAYSWLGFHCDLSDGDAVDFVYMADGQAQTVHTAGIHVPVADTWVKLGFKYDPAAIAAQRITTYVNGVAQSTFVTAAQIAAATFPDGEAMAPMLATKVGTAAESKFQMDWWRFAQMALPHSNALVSSTT
jgi:hypothetical protein